MKKDILNDISKWHNEFNDLNKRLEKSILSFENDIQNKNEKISSLQKQINDYKDQELFKDKFYEVSKQLEKEKERLKKLYHQFSKKEVECNNLKSEIEKWENWLESKKEIFGNMFSAAPVRNNKDNSNKS